MRFIFFLLVLLSFQSFVSAQTRGLILEPSTSVLGKSILDPNGDGYISASSSGFTANDVAESEIPYKTLIPAGTEPDSDLENAPNCGYTDFVESISGGLDPVMAYVKTVGTDKYWLFRMRMGGVSPNAKSYSIMIDTDNKIGSSDPSYTSTNLGFEYEIVLSTKFGVRVYKFVNPDGTSCTPVISYNGNDHYQKAIAYSTQCGNPDYFLDFFVNVADLTAAAVGLDPTTTSMRYVLADNTGADKSTLCNAASASDVGGTSGVGASFINQINEMIDKQSGCTISSINDASCQSKSACPTITGPIANNATSVTGTSSEVDGTEITVYKNGVALIGTAIVANGKWTKSSISPALTSGNRINASAKATNKTVSDTSCNRTIEASCPDTVKLSLLSIPSQAGKGICGAIGSAVAGATIKVYMDGAIVPNKMTDIVQSDGSWGFKCNTNQTSCSDQNGGTCLNNNTPILVTQTVGGCESAPVILCNGGSASTGAVTITTAINTSTSSISGTKPTNTAVYLYKNGTLIGQKSNDNTTSWTISGISGLSGCDKIEAKALFALDVRHQLQLLMFQLGAHQLQQLQVHIVQLRRLPQ
jgi:hypothetical protein